MSNNPFPIKHRDLYNLTERVYYVADTDAGKPASSLNAGDLCWAVDTGTLYVAINDTAMVKVSREDEGIFQLVIGFRDGAAVLGTLTAQFVTAQREWILPDVYGKLVAVSNGTNPPDTPGDMGIVNATAQAAAIASTNLTNTTPAGLYRINYSLRCTTADVTAGTITASFTYTDDVGATTDTTAAIVLTATTSRQAGSFVVYLASGNITYLTTLTGIIGTSRYQLRARCEFLG